jgi:hypothetical protein
VCPPKALHAVAAGAKWQVKLQPQQFPMLKHTWPMWSMANTVDAFLSADAPVGYQFFEIDCPYQSIVSSGGDDTVQRDGICCVAAVALSSQHDTKFATRLLHHAHKVVGPGPFQPKQ